MLQFTDERQQGSESTSYKDVLSGVESGRHTLWKVDDDKSIQEDMNVDTKGLYGIYDVGYEGPLSNDRDIINGACAYVKEILTGLGAPIDFFQFRASDIAAYVLTEVDYQLPYLLFEDTGIEYVTAPTDQLFRVRDQRSPLFNSILHPEQIEIYRIKQGWDFKNFAEAKRLIFHPDVQRLFADGPYVKQGADGAPMHFDISEVNKELMKTLWSLENAGSFEYFVDEIRMRVEEEIEYRNRKTKEYADAIEMRNMADNVDNIRAYVAFVSLLTIAWLKSPMALPYLVNCHAIYGELLFEGDDGRMKIQHGTNGYIIMLSKTESGIGYNSTTDISFFQGGDLDIIPATLGTCRSCGDSFHCAKYVNVTALSNQDCFCGEKVNPLSQETYDPYGMNSVHTKNECREFFRLNQPVFGHYCQRCLYKIASKSMTEIPCYRTRCPKTQCIHHQGMQAHMNALKAGRVNLIGPSGAGRQGFMNLNTERRV